MARHRPTALTALLLGALLGLVPAGVGASPAGVPASQPTQPPSEEPGGDGRCEVGPGRQIAADAGPVYVFEPGGVDRATIDGGRCDSPKRPTVFIAHGLNNHDPRYYLGFVRHLVSVGNIVVMPTYQVSDGEKKTLEQAFAAVNEGAVAAGEEIPRIDTGRIGFWGHSMGGGMIPYLVQQAGERGWGKSALWMSTVAQAYSLLVGAEEQIPVPGHTEAMVVFMAQDYAVDKRMGNDVFRALTVPLEQKRHVMIKSDVHGYPPLVADHGAPLSYDGAADAIDHLLYRYSDVLQSCSLSRRGCSADLAEAGTWSDGTQVARSEVTSDPVDSGVMPALISECDQVFGPMLNDRITWCGPSRF